MFTSYSRYHQQYQPAASTTASVANNMVQQASSNDENSSRTVSLYGGGGRRSGNTTGSHGASMYSSRGRASTLSSDPRSPKNAFNTTANTNINTGAMLATESPTHTTGTANNTSSAVSVNGPAITFSVQKIIGQGTFGTVFLAKINETGEVVAIKKVLQDKVCKHRELQIMKQLHRLPHPFVLQLKFHYTSKGTSLNIKAHPEEYLNLVLEYMPETLYSVIRSYTKRQDVMPVVLAKNYLFQLLRALAHLHGLGLVHRDVKPQNLLVDPAKGVLKLADFGSAKPLVHGEVNVAYIGSRYYRAPELILGNVVYSTSIDVWSAGCVFAEMMLGTPVFPGMSAADQLIEIVKVLGSPTEEQLHGITYSLHASDTDSEEDGSSLAGKRGKERVKVPMHIPAKCMYKVFSCANPQPQAIALISALLEYHPEMRVKAIDACTHPYFNELKLPGVCLPNGSGLPRNLLHFTKEELQLASPERLRLLSPFFTEQDGTLPLSIVEEQEDGVDRNNKTTAEDANNSEQAVARTGDNSDLSEVSIGVGAAKATITFDSTSHWQKRPRRFSFIDRILSGK